MTTRCAYSLFEVRVSYEYEVTRRDEFGWVSGSEPGKAPWKKLEDTYRIVCMRKDQARERALTMFSGPGMRSVEVVDINSTPLDALVVELNL